MRPRSRIATLPVVLALLVVAAPARAQWTRIDALPADNVFSLAARGDTIVAGLSDRVGRSVDGGTNWDEGANLPTTPLDLDAVRLEPGRLWAGTYGGGVFTSTSLGDAWQPFSQGLAGGLFNSHLYITEFERRGAWLHASTDGAGVFRLDLGALIAWEPYNTNLVGTAGGSVPGLDLGGVRLVCANGGNGYVFHNDEGDTDWTASPLNNVGISPGLQASDVAWTGTTWLVAAQTGVYRSPSGEGPWTFASHGLSSRLDGNFAVAPGRTFAVFNSLAQTTYLYSVDGGATWLALESFPGYTYELLFRDGVLWAGRSDGLWRRDVATVGVGGPAPQGEWLALVGRQPVRGEARLRYTLAAETRVTLAVFDVRGREVARLVDGVQGAGTRDVAWRAPRGAGVYHARLRGTAGDRTIRIVAIP